MSITWAIPASRFRQNFILKFLREAKGSSCPVEVHLFVPHRLYGRKPLGSRTESIHSPRGAYCIASQMG